MEAKKNVALIGMMGSGKTTCGQLLAQRLGRPFVDCDDYIQVQAGRTIPELFADLGEEGFRALERRAIQTLSTREGLVLSLIHI